MNTIGGDVCFINKAIDFREYQGLVMEIKQQISVEPISE
jgi:hypothetical protein